jgi:hypothetical protein
MHRRTWTIIAAVLAAFALITAACGDDSESTSTDGGDGDSAVSVDDPWSRATAASATNGAAYMTLTASSDDALVGATVDASIAREAQVHEVVEAGDMEDGDGDMDDADGDMDDMDDTDGDMDDMEHESGDGMAMQEVAEIPLPAGEPVVLEPGGYHIMMLDLAAPLTAGETFELELEFESRTQTVTVEVQEI